MQESKRKENSFGMDKTDNKQGEHLLRMVEKETNGV